MTRAADDMNSLKRLLVISLCVLGHSITLGDALLRFKGGYNEELYDNNQGSDVDKFIYAAIPLHGPVPVLQVISKKPLSQIHTQSSSSRPEYVRAPYHHNRYASLLHEEDEYAAPDYRPDPPDLGHTQTLAAHQLDGMSQSPSQNDLTIIYARPNPNGGYTYRRKPTNTKTVSKRPSIPVAPSHYSHSVTTESPVVLRVHKYRIVRDV